MRDQGPANAQTRATQDVPLASVLIRSMDRATLDRALDSAARQTWPNVEIVVVAACGARHRRLPGTWEGRPLRLVLPEPDRTLSRPEAANLALDNARGEWLNFLDDDDEFFPEHIQTLLEARGTAAQRVRYSRAEVRDPDGNTVGTSGRAGFHAQLYFQARSSCAGTIYHRSLIDEGARFDPEFLLMEDRDFMVNCASRTPFGFVDATTCVWHAYVGESGTGHGGNENSEVRDRYLPMLRRKWAPLFDAWLAEPQALIFLGQHELREGNTAAATRYLEEALLRAPADVNALNLCGMAHFHADNLERAEYLVAQAVARLPDHPKLRENLELIRGELTRGDRP